MKLTFTATQTLSAPADTQTLTTLTITVDGPEKYIELIKEAITVKLKEEDKKTDDYDIEWSVY